MKLFCFLTAFLLVVAGISCRKDNFIHGPDARLGISVDTLHFDTVFTSTGSISQAFKIYNQNDRKLLINEVSLAGGNNSSFNININGQADPARNNIEVDPNDSIYVFVSVRIDPSSNQLPFVIRDSIKISFNGNERWVQLDAWGQDANFLRAHRISTNTIWTNGKPYVLLDGLVVDPGITLTIQEGTRIYSHANSPIIVQGTLRVLGDHHDSTRVVFRSDRLDEPYSEFPGSWPGIFFREESYGNEIRYAEIRNAYQGLVLEGPASTGEFKLKISETRVDNCFDAGILSFGSSIDATNLIVSNCGKGILMIYGGNYLFRHCTVSAISTNYFLHKEPAIILTDFYQDGATVHINDTKAIFENNIFWGDNGTVSNEVVVNRQGNKPFDVVFDHGIWKLAEIPANIEYSGMILNEDPLFEESDTENHRFSYRLTEGSPAIDKARPSGVTIDYENKMRDALLPDLGAFEK